MKKIIICWVLILAGLTLPAQEKGISYTEKEYRYAKSIGLPILAYIKNDEAITADKVDDDPEKLKKLQVFKDDVTRGREVKWFSTIDQLGTEVTLSLHKEMDRKKRPGWIRGDAVDLEKSLSEIVELSKQNRELQEENKRLSVELEKLKSVSERKPLLTITLGCTKPDDDEEYSEYYQREELIKFDEDGTVHCFTKDLTDVDTPLYEKYCMRNNWKIYDEVNELQLKEYQRSLNQGKK